MFQQRLDKTYLTYVANYYYYRDFKLVQNDAND